MAFYDRVRFKPSGAPGTGAITVGTAETGFRTPAGASIPNSTALTLLAEDGAAWEIFESVYTTSGTSCSRGTLIDSSTGSRLSLSATASIVVIASARQIVDKHNGDTFVGILKIANGTVGAPGLSFGSDDDNGLYRIGANNWALSAGGVKIIDLVGSGNVATQVVAFPGTLAATAYNAASVTLAGGLGVAGAIISNSTIQAGAASGYKLDSTTVMNSGGGYLSIYDTSGASKLIIGASGDNYQKATTHNFQSADAATTFARLTSTGFGIGVAPSNKLHVSQAGSATFTTLIVNSHASTPYGLQLSLSGAAAPTGGYFLICSDSVGNKLLIRGDGNVTNTNNSYGAISDRRWKRDIVDAQSYIDRLMQTRLRNYWLNDDEAAAPIRLGVIAQEAESLWPELVDTDAKGFKQFNYMGLLMPTVQAVQSLHERVAALEARAH